MAQGMLQGSPTSPDSGISSGSSMDEINSAKKESNTGSPKENVHFTFPRPFDNIPEHAMRSSVLRPTHFTSVIASPSANVITATTAAMVSKAVVRNFSYPTSMMPSTSVIPTGVITSVLKHIKQEGFGVKMEEERGFGVKMEEERGEEEEEEVEEEGEEEDEEEEDEEEEDEEEEKEDEDGCNLMCSDEEFSDESEEDFEEQYRGL